MASARPSRTRLQTVQTTVITQICSTMRGCIKGTDSTINAILATTVLYELRWKIWNCAGEIQFVIKTVIKTVMTTHSARVY